VTYLNDLSVAARFLRAWKPVITSTTIRRRCVEGHQDQREHHEPWRIRGCSTAVVTSNTGGYQAVSSRAAHGVSDLERENLTNSSSGTGPFL